MVKRVSNTRFFIPLALSLVLALVYYIFGTKYFFAALVLMVGGFLSLIDFRVAIFALTFAMPFLPNTLALLGFIGLGFLYFLRRIFVEKSTSVKGIYAGVIGIYLLIIIIQTVTSLNLMGSVRDLGLHLAAILYFYAVVNTIKTKEDLNSYLTVLMFSVTLVAFIGLLQIFTGVEIQREWLDVQNNPDIQVRVFSVFGNPNTLAEYLVLFIPLAMGMFWHTKSLKKKIVFALGVGCMLVALVFTMSRGGWIGLAMAAFVFCLLVDKRLLLLSIPLVFVALLFMPATFLNRIMSIGNTADSSNNYRLQIWDITMDVIRDYPVAGVGFGHMPYKQVFETYIRTMPIFHAHNSFIQTIAEIGFAGFMVFVAMLVTFVKYPINVLVKQKDALVKDSYFKYIGVGVAAGIIGVFTHGLVENVLYLPKIIFSFWTVVGIGAMAINIFQRSNPKIVEDKDQAYLIYRGSDSYE